MILRPPQADCLVSLSRKCGSSRERQRIRSTATRTAAVYLSGEGDGDGDINHDCQKERVRWVWNSTSDDGDRSVRETVCGEEARTATEDAAGVATRDEVETKNFTGDGVAVVWDDEESSRFNVDSPCD